MYFFIKLNKFAMIDKENQRKYNCIYNGENKKGVFMKNQMENNKRKKRLIIAIISIITLMLVIGISYAYFYYG